MLLHDLTTLWPPTLPTVFRVPYEVFRSSEASYLTPEVRSVAESAAEGCQRPQRQKHSDRSLFWHFCHSLDTALTKKQRSENLTEIVKIHQKRLQFIGIIFLKMRSVAERFLEGWSTHYAKRRLKVSRRLVEHDADASLRKYETYEASQVRFLHYFYKFITPGAAAGESSVPIPGFKIWHWLTEEFWSILEKFAAWSDDTLDTLMVSQSDKTVFITVR